MAKYKIVISGYYGFRNAGDEAMLYAMLRSLRGFLPEAEITVISGRPEDTARQFHTKAVPRFGGFAILKSLLACDLLISGGGSLLQDVTSSRSLLYYLSIIFAGVVLRKKVFLYAQGIGPVRRKWVASLLSFVLSRVDAVTVRDEKSRRFLEDLGVAAPVYTTADSVFSLPASSLEEGREILREAGVPEGKPIIGISVRNWLRREEWMPRFAKYIDRLARDDVSVVFIPMQCPEDTETARRICGTTPKNVYFLSRSYTAPQLMSIIGNLNVLAGMRLHALIFSALMHVPLLGISYDPKIDNFLRAIGEEALCPITALDEKTLYNKTMEWLRKGKDGRSWEAVEALRKKAGTTTRILEGLIRRS